MRKLFKKIIDFLLGSVVNVTVEETPKPVEKPAPVKPVEVVKEDPIFPEKKPIILKITPVTSSACYKKFGDPKHETSMILFDVPPEIEIGSLPNRVYCNKLLVEPLRQAFTNIVDRGLVDEVRTWDGCFNIREKKGGSSASLHSWGLAIDINAAWNQFGRHPTMKPELVACFTDAGFKWGGEWSRPDGMHFELASF